MTPCARGSVMMPGVGAKGHSRSSNVLRVVFCVLRGPGGSDHFASSEEMRFGCLQHKLLDSNEHLASVRGQGRRRAMLPSSEHRASSITFCGASSARTARPGAPPKRRQGASLSTRHADKHPSQPSMSVGIPAPACSNIQQPNRTERALHPPQSSTCARGAASRVDPAAASLVQPALQATAIERPRPSSSQPSLWPDPEGC